MGFQNKLSIKTSPYLRKISDIHLKHLGFNLTLLRIEYTENKYGDRTFSLVENKKIDGAYINYPGSEIPLLYNRTNTSENNSIHLSDLLPIEIFIPFSYKINKGDMVIHKVKVNAEGDKTDSSNFRLIVLEIVDVLTKGSMEVVYIRYEGALLTLDIATDLPDLTNIYNTILNEPWE